MQTLTENMFPLCPVLMISLGVYLNGSHNIMCRSSEADANILKNNDIMKLVQNMFQMYMYTDRFDTKTLIKYQNLN